jgi:hypothetical protein
MRQLSKNLTNRGGTSLLVALVAFTVVAALPGVADAQTKVTPINGTQGVESVVEGRGDGGGENRVNSGFAHLDGPAQHSSARGLRLAGQKILITNRTSVFPNISGVSNGLRANQLSGRELTVFGKITPRGIEAVLVIVRPTGGEETSFPGIDTNPDKNFVPSATNPRVGHAPSNTEE